MSDKSLATYTSRQLMVRDSKTEIENTTRKLMKLASGWRKLNAEQAVELAVASYITGANPFLGEIYHMGDQGITLGVAWFQRKAAEAIQHEIGRPGSVKPEFRPASHEDAVFDEAKGDIAWTCQITDTATQQRNFDDTTKLFVLLVEKGMGADKAWDIAERKIGAPQTWEASAVVYGDESFAKDGKPEKWDRNERCKKRCLKWALKKRFPNMEFISENDDDLVTIDATAKEVVREVARVVEKEPPRPQDVVLNDLGFDPEPDKVVDVPDQSRPYSPEQVKARVAKLTKEAAAAGVKASDTARKIVASVLDTTLEDQGTSRYIVCKWLVGKESTKDMSDAQVIAIKSWLGVDQFNQPPEQVVISEVAGCLQQALKDKGQLELGV